MRVGDDITELFRKIGYTNLIIKQPMQTAKWLAARGKEKEDKVMSVMKINKENFVNEVLNSDKPVILDFYADWCGPCRMVGPIMEEIAAERSDIKVGKINVDEESELAAQFRVMSIPMLAVVRDGKVVNTSVGAKPKAQILAML